MERQAINERISAARDRLEANGESWGRPRRMSEEEIKHARTLRKTGLTFREVAKAVKVPLATVHRALRP